MQDEHNAAYTAQRKTISQTIASTEAGSHLALKLDSFPSIISLPGRVYEPLEVDREGARGLKSQLCAPYGAFDAPALCQRPIGDVALVLHGENILSWS